MATVLFQYKVPAQHLTVTSLDITLNVKAHNDYVGVSVTFLGNIHSSDLTGVKDWRRLMDDIYTEADTLLAADQEVFHSNTMGFHNQQS